MRFQQKSTATELATHCFIKFLSNVWYFGVTATLLISSHFQDFVHINCTRSYDVKEICAFIFISKGDFYVVYCIIVHLLLCALCVKALFVCVFPDTYLSAREKR